jgi:[protein-PII] uridylyltransferase
VPRSRREPSAAFLEDRRHLFELTSLGGAAFARAYSALVDAWLRTLLGPTPDVALVAVGALGRSELCPGSDLDLVLIHRGLKPARLEQLTADIWYPIWDAGLKLDHSVRTVTEALAVADREIETAMGLLDARIVAGDGALGGEIVERALGDWRKAAHRRLDQLAKLTAERHADVPEVAFALEPDLKRAKGGSRDVVTLGIMNRLGLVAAPSPALRSAADTLLEVRVELQRPGGSSNQLFLDRQDQVAQHLGIDADELMERVSEAGRTVGWESDDAWRAVWSSRGSRRHDRARPVAPGVVVRDGEIHLADDVAVDAELVLRCAAAAAYEGQPIAKTALRRCRDGLAPLTDRWPDAVRDAFVSLLGGGRPALEQFETLDRYGLLSRVLPEWELVRSRPQRNAFHRFTVDRHLLEAVTQACELIREVARPDLLLVGTLLHDLGKGLPGDHTDNGVLLADRIARRMGFDDADVETIVAMVELHLLLPAVATGRDLEDVTTMESVAAAVLTSERLDLLAALTEADSLATGPAAWSKWKAELLGRLVTGVRAALAGREAVAVVVAPVVPDGYDGTPLVEGSVDVVRVIAPATELSLPLQVGALGIQGQDVRRARSWVVDGVAVSEFQVAARFGRAADWTTYAADLVAWLEQPDELGRRLDELAAPYRNHHRAAAARPAPPRVIVGSAGGGRDTLVEVRVADGIGVLFRITQALVGLDLRVHRAFVSTLGHEVVDTFYVTRPDGAAVSDPGLVGRIEPAVVAALAGDETRADVRSSSET